MQQEPDARGSARIAARTLAQSTSTPRRSGKARASRRQPEHRSLAVEHSVPAPFDVRISARARTGLMKFKARGHRGRVRASPGLRQWRAHTAAASARARPHPLPLAWTCLTPVDGIFANAVLFTSQQELPRSSAKRKREAGWCVFTSHPGGMVKRWTEIVRRLPRRPT